MNFDFTIRAHGFEKAAAVEAALKNIGVPYDVKMSKGVGSKKRTRRTLTKSEVTVIAHNITKYPNRTVAEHAKQNGVSRATVERIKKGIHPLQKRTNVTKLPNKKAAEKK